MNPRKTILFFFLMTFVLTVFGLNTVAWADDNDERSSSSSGSSGATSGTSSTGATLYGQYCASCHGTLANSNVKGHSLSDIQNAIRNIRRMRNLSRTLTTSQLSAIATALSSTSSGGTGDTGGTGGTDGTGGTGGTSTGEALYTQYCASCHGSFANTRIPGRTSAQIVTAISSVSSMRNLSFLTSTQINDISAALSGTTSGGAGGDTGGTGGTGGAGGTDAATAHASITAYNGPSTCVACHQTEAQDMFGSAHYQWNGPTPFVDNISGNSGKNNKAINTYCGTVSTSFSSACWSCHVGYGKQPSATMSTEQLNNIDCLVCHQDKYKRTPAGPFTTATGLSPNGGAYTWQIPVFDSQGGYSYKLDTAKMTISILEAARTVTKPTTVACLTCHAKSGGGNGVKRGDLALETASAPRNLEIHMSPQGANLNCQACHTTTNHKILGRGLDLRESDVQTAMTCQTSGCHTATPHSSSQLNMHTTRVACQTCHIPTFANQPAEGTELDRDWTQPYWEAALCSGQGGWHPATVDDSNVVPTYKWYNQHSNIYSLGTTALTRNSAGEYEFAWPVGSRTITESQIYPMKEHTSNEALASNGQIVPFSTTTYFMTADFNKAVAEGMAQAGMTGSWTLVRAHNYQTINHGVQPKENALSCGECHTSLRTSSSQLVRMDLQGELGYALKGSQSSVCTQCHERESNPGFTRVHSIHVDSRRYDCNRCHTFSK